MQEFILTSKKFVGSIRFSYNETRLVSYENNAELDSDQFHFLSVFFPHTLGGLDRLRNESQSLIITEVTDLSFESFWEKYGYKEGKIRAKKEYEKLNKNDKMSAISGIASYKNRCKLNNTAMLYPERYIKYRRWEDGK